MDSNIENLFEHILSTEKKAQQRRAQINEVKQKNQQIMDAINENCRNMELLHEDLTLKEQTLMECNVKLKHLSSKLEIQQKHKAELLAQIAHMKRSNKEKREEYEQRTQCFHTDVIGFLDAYDLCSDGRSKRNSKAKNALNELKIKESALRKELEKMETRKERIEKLEVDKREEEEIEMAVSSELGELNKKLEEKKLETEEAEKLKMEIGLLPTKDPEFVHLQQELLLSRQEASEDFCAALQAELQELHQMKWQQQMNVRHDDMANQRSFKPGPTKRWPNNGY